MRPGRIAANRDSVLAPAAWEFFQFRQLFRGPIDVTICSQYVLIHFENGLFDSARFPVPLRYPPPSLFV